MIDAGQELEQKARFFAALADPTRLQIVGLLAESPGEMSGSDIADRLGISLALQCHHNRVLSEAGVILKRKEGQTSYFSLNRKFLRLSLKGLY